MATSTPSSMLVSSDNNSQCELEVRESLPEPERMIRGLRGVQDVELTSVDGLRDQPREVGPGAAGTRLPESPRELRVTAQLTGERRVESDGLGAGQETGDAETEPAQPLRHVEGAGPSDEVC